ncbi:hypothetical protein GGI15_004257 [Coemansia interrupta]|uniref:rRNA-processing protein FYV7 n=1 Tax=Coemansia interrupta TaxID=1126814 RepID=A0A9W8H401_9FUNG|nr:hypothetical protein GGI15_004257 [Coemansia interrupta]
MAFTEGGEQRERRRMPQSMALDTRIQRTYKGKIIKQRIDRNQKSNVKRKYFKELKKEGLETTPQRHTRNSPDGDASGDADLSARPGRAPRSNPYEKLVRVRDEVKRQKEEERRRKNLEIQQVEKRRSDYMHERKEERKKYNARTKRGQPVLSNQIGSLLEKIKRG